MRRCTIIAALIAALVVPSSASAAAIRECGNYGDTGNGRSGWTYGTVYGAGIFNVTTRRVWCSVARPLSRKAFNTYEGGKAWRWKGWRCRILRAAHEYYDVRCTKRRRHIVRWQTGA